MKQMILDDGTNLSIAWRLKQKRLRFLNKQIKKKEMLMTHGKRVTNSIYDFLTRVDRRNVKKKL